ncbi:MAG: hypothetical protein M1838_002098 [Thelocarpon superellum]|nr:MAG: hypothetical protein M1838_002098 [Thelocarpon superellum]
MENSPHVQIATNDIHPVKSNTAYVPHGVRRVSRSSVRDETEVENPYKLREDDVRNGGQPGRPKYTGWVLAWLAYQSTGVIYGDIGTSPLYVYSSTFSSEPSYDDLLGVLSVIIWTLTLIVTVKYICIVLYADDDGEGGTFALYSLLARYANITRSDPKAASMVKMERYLSSDMKPSNKSIRSILERSQIARFFLKLLGVLGVSLIIADGALTPAQSVLGAIQGLTVANANINNATIVGVSCAILILLYLIQPFGTSKLASGFAPVVIIWLLFNLSFGIYNLAMFDHSVLKAFSPYFAGQYFVRNGTDGWKSLGGILLVFTGVEALFADLGAFSRKAIQLSWLCFAFPCLLITYIGQAAYISSNKGAYSNPFFNSVPPGMFYPGLVISILAAVVASQAIITGTFQLLSQVMKLSYFPHIKIVHTSERFVGHIYIPVANWLLMIATVVVTAAFTNTTSLGNAYGVCVILVTFITTIMVSIVALVAWKINVFVVLGVFLVFGCLDGLYLTSAMIKVPNGAWATLAIAFVLSGIFALWRFGKEQQWEAESASKVPGAPLITMGEDGVRRLSAAYGGGELAIIRGIGIFFDKSGWTTPTVFENFVRKFEAQPEVTVFFHMRPLNVSTVPFEERYAVSRVLSKGSTSFRLIVRHGYNDLVTTADLACLVLEQLTKFIVFEHADKGSADIIVTAKKAGAEGNGGDDGSNGDGLAAELSLIQRAHASQVLYLVGQEKLHVRDDANIFRRILLSAFIWIRNNTRSKIAAMKLPRDQLVEMGFAMDL